MIFYSNWLEYKYIFSLIKSYMKFLSSHYYITQLSFFLFIFISIVMSYIFQRYMGADVYSTSWYTDVSDWNLRNVKQIFFIHMILLGLVIILPILGIFYKRYKYICLSMVTSFISLFFLSQWLWFNWFWNCQNFCGFFTAFLTPIIIVIIGGGSTLFLYILNRKK